jgi:hypothetical protein
MPDWASSFARWTQTEKKPLVFLFWLAIALIAATLVSWIVPYVPQSLAVYLLVVLLWWLRTVWFRHWSPTDVAGAASFPVASSAIIGAIVLWLGSAALYDNYYHTPPILEFPTLVAGLALAVATSLLLSLWLARLYWDSRTRLALLEQIVTESTGVDLAELRRKYFAESQWRDKRATFLLRQIAQDDLPSLRNDGSETDDESATC